VDGSAFLEKIEEEDSSQNDVQNRSQKAKITVMQYATGMARVAGFLSTTIRTNTERMGNNESADRIPMLMPGIYKTTVFRCQIWMISLL
jgi:hypothetical protein